MKMEIVGEVKKEQVVEMIRQHFKLEDDVKIEPIILEGEEFIGFEFYQETSE